MRRLLQWSREEGWLPRQMKVERSAEIWERPGMENQQDLAVNDMVI